MITDYRGVPLKISQGANIIRGRSNAKKLKKKTQKNLKNPQNFKTFAILHRFFSGGREGRGASFYTPEEIRAEVNGTTVSSEMSFIFLEIDVLFLTFSSKSQLDYVFLKSLVL